MKKPLIIVLIILLILAILFAAFVITANLVMVKSTEQNILSVEEAADSGDFDCILVLGCKVRDDGTPSDMLNDRVARGSELFLAGAAPVILMSGDHTGDYNEVAAMRVAAIDAGVPDECIMLDHEGFSTYESVFRAKEEFGFEKILIFTQGYHLPRAIYIAKSLGIDACGVASDLRTYGNQFNRNVRETAARTKDFVKLLFNKKD